MPTTSGAGKIDAMSPAHRSTSPARAHILIAVKELRVAKTRLAGILEPAHRTELVLSMLRDTLSAVNEVDEVSGITVVTPDPVVSAAARELGANVFADPISVPGPASRAETGRPENALNLALAAAAEHVRGTDRRVNLIALQADLPSLRGWELSEALAAAGTGGRSIVVDHHGTGTAALFACDPALALDPRFGDGSARHHLDSGARRLEGAWPGLRTDVDTADDLEAARALGMGASTTAALGGADRKVPQRFA